MLPFENLSPDPNDASFAVGMQDEIVTQLTKIRGLRVIPVRVAAGALPPNVVRELNVTATLGGNLSYSEGRVRVTPQLIEYCRDSINKPQKRRVPRCSRWAIW